MCVCVCACVCMSVRLKWFFFKSIEVCGVLNETGSVVQYKLRIFLRIDEILMEYLDYKMTSWLFSRISNIHFSVIM